MDFIVKRFEELTTKELQVIYIQCLTMGLPVISYAV